MTGIDSQWGQHLADALRRLLQEKGWNQSELARRADIGRDNISRYLNGRHLPTPVHLKKLADAFGVSQDTLCPGDITEIFQPDYTVELKLLKDNPAQALVKINQVMPTEIALQIVALANSAKVS